MEATSCEDLEDEGREKEKGKEKQGKEGRENIVIEKGEEYMEKVSSQEFPRGLRKPPESLSSSTEGKLKSWRTTCSRAPKITWRM